MNCKPGDLAVIVRSNQISNIGKIVTVLRVYPRAEQSWWICSGSVLHGLYSDWPPGAEVGMYDNHMRPIRDNDGEDEMIRIAGLPHKEIA